MDRTPYVYKLTDMVTGKWYIGSNYRKRCEPSWLGTRYFTTSQIVEPLFRAAPDRFIKEIICIGSVEYVVETEALILKMLDAKNDPNSYNGHNGDGKMNCSKFGGLAGKKVGPIVGKRMAEEKRGVCAPGMASIGGKVGGRIGGKKIAELGIGIHTPEARKANGHKTFDMKKGIHAKENLGSGAKVANSLKYKCLECGMITNPGALGRHQKYLKHNGKEIT